VPVDPIIGNSSSWKIIMEDASQAVSSTEPGIFDVRSGSDKIGLDGTPYAEW
jgi:general secretion pathway protein G